MRNINEIKMIIERKEKSSINYYKNAKDFKVGEYITSPQGEVIYITNIRETPKMIEFTGLGKHGMSVNFKRNKWTISNFK